MPKKKQKVVQVKVADTSVCSLLGVMPGVKPTTTPETASHVEQEAIPLCSTSSDIADVCIVSERVSILDPLMLTRIKKPVRGVKCEHGGIFDRDIYVAFNRLREKRKNCCKLRHLWLCPHCNNPTPEHCLMDLPAFAALLATLDEDSNAEYIIISKDGTLSVD